MTATTASAAEQFVYFGTGGDPAEGIYRATLNLNTGKISEAQLVAKINKPGFLAFNPNQTHLYAVCLIGPKRIGGVSAFAIDRADGSLQLLNQESVAGDNPCHLSVDHTGRCVLTANYSSGSVSALPIDENGRVGPAASVIKHEGSSVNKHRQEAPHAHSINIDPANRFAFAADLGIDKVVIYKLDPAKPQLTQYGAADLAPGSGPRHLAFHPSGEYVYVINELLSTITVFAYDAERGELRTLQTIATLPEGFAGENTTAEVQVHPSGKFVYGSNRGHDTIAAFACDPDTGRLTFVEREPIRGVQPRNFGIDPTGAYLVAAGHRSNSVAVFRIDQKTGALDFTGSEIEVPQPICVKFLTKED